VETPLKVISIKNSFLVRFFNFPIQTGIKLLGFYFPINLPFPYLPSFLGFSLLFWYWLGLVALLIKA